jgi:hypothetical protein
MKKCMLIGLSCLAFLGTGVLTKAEAGVQVSINLGGPRYYHRPAPVYCWPEPAYHYDCPPPVVYRRRVVVYSRPAFMAYPPAYTYNYDRPYRHCR